MDTTGGGEAQSELVNKATSEALSASRVWWYIPIMAMQQKLYLMTRLLQKIPLSSTATASVVTETSSAASQQSVTESRIKQARMQGYEEEAALNTQNFTLVRSGTCLKCNTCGSTNLATFS